MLRTHLRSGGFFIWPTVYGAVLLYNTSRVIFDTLPSNGHARLQVR
jgi:hypothetical protein